MSLFWSNHFKENIQRYYQNQSWVNDVCSRNDLLENLKDDA